MTVLNKTVPRFRRGANLRPVHSIKHVIDFSGSTVAGTQTTVDLIHAVDAPVITTGIEVETGSRVNSIFLNVIAASSNTAGLANIYFILYKNPGANIAIAQVPNANNTGISDFKKQIFHTEMVMTEKNTTAIPRTMFKGVLMIPKHFRRFGPNDELTIQIFSPVNTFDFCVECIYKEYR